MADQQVTRVRFSIPNERPMSWNTMYAGTHWSKRKDKVDLVHALVREHCPPCHFDSKVTIKVIAWFKNKPLDPDNVTAKLYIDGLRKAGVLDDDTHQQIEAVTVCSRFASVDNHVEIVIEAL